MGLHHVLVTQFVALKYLLNKVLFLFFTIKSGNFRMLTNQKIVTRSPLSTVRSTDTTFSKQKQVKDTKNFLLNQPKRPSFRLLYSYVMFMGFHVLVGSSIHSVWSSLFVLTTEVMPEPKRVANGAVFNFGNFFIFELFFPFDSLESDTQPIL